ncbi:fanconi anemia group M protein [Fonsecaea erecta]|uniref:ATP-dependent DNA helicase n=1 Tax=Fonsecaea erecta TaxID=1367422 RepID=A0A178ZE13_9EURO|nr:fanconi anemia group M protein [Fonsecaea erecta]OAP57706.1 fanconi anemia group M protein [Fonsecaea erecta]
MDFLDDEAGCSSDVLVPSSQQDLNPRARKRRRLDSHSDDSPFVERNEYDLPPNDDETIRETKKTKYEERIHVPQYGDRPPDTFVTQLTQQHSSPSRIRGPRWMKPRKIPSPSSSAAKRQTNIIGRQPEGATHSDEFEVDEDDLELFEALGDYGDPTFSNGNTFSVPIQGGLNGNLAPRRLLQKSNSFRQTTLHGIHTTQSAPTQSQSQSRVHSWPLANRNEPLSHHELNYEAMTTWVYPTNLGRIRDYQYNIVHKGLFHNILVALPTGLGKTFIAATIMLNWYRWTTKAQIVFVAPTKPLVSQQVDACFNIAGIPRSQTTMLTGEVSPAIRAEEWQEKRVFFMTPQTLINDLKHGYCDPKRIVLIVVDEAHKATGSYAYVEVVKFLRRFNSSFRVLALTATPGKDVEKVQEVIDGLGIARVEIRTEESLDIREFVHRRNVEIQVFENSEEITMSLEMLSAALQPLLNKLHSQGASWGKDPRMITLFGLKKAWERWQSSEAGRRAQHSVKGMVRAISTTLMSLAHNIELLKYHGIGPFYHKMKLFADEASSGGKYAKQIVDDDNFKKLMVRLRGWINNPDFIGHPKLSYLKTVVLNHFMDAGESASGSHSTGSSGTRIMIFTHYRDSAEEIVRVLSRHGPMIRAHVFVGQSGTKGGSEGMDQKTQLNVIKQFKAGKYNTIVATSIGEEGLDIGEVDLIVCYDCSKSPIRMLQRMGRTGRKRAGNIVLLMMRGKEESDFAHSEDNYQKMQEKIASGREFNFHEELSVRIVPKELIPAVDKRVIEIPIENTQPGSAEPSRRKARKAKKPPKKFHMPDGVETGFTFLGKGKKKTTATTKEKTSNPPEARNDRDVATLPPLKDVLLSELEERLLEDRYVRLAGVEDEYIQCVRFDAYPDQQRILGKTDAVKHSRTTKTLVKAFEAMRDPRQGWSRPLEYGVLPEVDGSLPELSEAKKPARTTEASSSKLKSRTYTRTNVASDAVRSSSIGEYDDNDSFIDDGEDVGGCPPPRPRWQAKSGSDGGTDDDLFSPLRKLRSSSPVHKDVAIRVEKRFNVSQQSIDYDSIDDYLPDLQDLFSPKTRKIHAQQVKVRSAAMRASPRAREKVTNHARRKGARRVIDSDDDE